MRSGGCKEPGGRNLKVQLKYQSEDELGELADSFRETISALNDYVSAVEEGLWQLETES